MKVIESKTVFYIFSNKSRSSCAWIAKRPFPAAAKETLYRMFMNISLDFLKPG